MVAALPDLVPGKAAASISPGTAAWHLHRAGFIRHRMPAVWQAWRCGSLTQSKVFACYEELFDCADAVIDEFIHTFFDDDLRGRDELTAFERAVGRG